MWSNENKCPEGLFGLNEINVKTHSRETQFHFVKKDRLTRSGRTEPGTPNNLLMSCLKLARQGPQVSRSFHCVLIDNTGLG